MSLIKIKGIIKVKKSEQLSILGGCTVKVKGENLSCTSYIMILPENQATADTLTRYI